MLFYIQTYLPIVFPHSFSLTPNIRMLILYTVLQAYPKKLTRRICWTIKSLFDWWSSFILMILMFESLGLCWEEKADASHQRSRVKWDFPLKQQVYLFFRKQQITWTRIAVGKFWTTNGSRKRFSIMNIESEFSQILFMSSCNTTLLRSIR